jgi:hypothetical protein
VSYSADISRANPGCVLFLIDASQSMEDHYPLGAQTTKASEVETILNRCLQDLIMLCAKEDGVRDYFHVGVINYQMENASNALSGELNDNVLQPISRLESFPLAVEERTQKISDGVGGLIEHQVKFPVWYRAKANGGTPMRAALQTAAEELAIWCDEHRTSFPPVTIHLTDGQSTDGDPEEIATLLREIKTDDGEVILMNVHIDPLDSADIKFPSSDAGISNQFARLLYRMSSILPESMARYARELGYEIDTDARAFVFGARPEDVIQFFEIGTRPSALR